MAIIPPVYRTGAIQGRLFKQPLRDVSDRAATGDRTDLGVPGAGPPSERGREQHQAVTGREDDEEGDGLCAVPVKTKAGVWARWRRWPRLPRGMAPLPPRSAHTLWGASHVGTTGASEATRDVGRVESASFHQRTPSKQRTP